MDECKHAYGMHGHPDGSVHFDYSRSRVLTRYICDRFSYCPKCGDRLYMMEAKKYKVTGNIYLEVIPGDPTTLINVSSLILCECEEEAMTKVLRQVGGKQKSYTLKAVEVEE